MIYIFDGAMGTMLQNAGLPPGYCPELWNQEQPAVITAIHKSYIDSGSDIIETNTFGANRIKLTHYGLEKKVALLNTAAVQAARAACGPNTKIAGSVGPTGKLIVPLGDLSFDDAYDVFFEQISALDQAGVDMILIETIIDIQEMRAALLAAKAASKKPVICQMSFGADERTVTGTDPVTATIILEAMGADIIGVNCSLGPAQLLPIVEKIAQTTNCPISVQANAGMPSLINKQTVFPMQPEEMGLWAKKLVTAGARYIGGCCGTTPKHIKSIYQAVKNLNISALPAVQLAKKSTALTSRSKTIYLGADHPTVIIGERINPTGRKQLAADIASGQFISVKKEALSQVRAGAQLLDVNMGVPGIDQAKAMQYVIQELSMLVDTPLVIDTTDVNALEAGLKAYPGRALINSVSAESERLDSFLPLAKKYGAAILCLPISPTGVPKTAQDRLLVTQSIIHRAFDIGLKPGDFVLDALILTAAADASAGLEALATLKLYRQHLGYPTTMGLSNISFGLPRRDLINATFCAMALNAGLDAPILNPYDPLMQQTLAASALLLGHDPSGRSYSVNYAPTNQSEERAAPLTPKNIIEEIHLAIVSGEKEAVVPLVEQALKEGHSSIEISEQALTTAMNKVGIAFGSGQCFLPQVLLAAESMRAAFLTIKKELPAHTTTSLGTVILATVKGDIHDLGKNIVAALLENNGFTVIDLGKDISPEKIVEKTIEHQADIVGLCALMTTTMPQIDQTIAALKAAGCSAQTIVGGAVLTQEYANQANADSYAANGVDAVTIAKGFMADKVH
ncbi:homocysteine S-methyltransferase family protein [Pelosinus propionicus]|uniref:Methionine synthase n=1 Tax=Pelosinus propionicus DSM 13327 TaxID=1123291 RepID=A0A1I4KXE3_9FIRM|nr:homocysteine S-methyltransferase family protein [Pelosinus propionicus]SFL83474.1 5-methyltetrahydrofolate--homocysteine methyltransferase [Pelosinus propionicus DSM 13327]